MQYRKLGRTGLEVGAIGLGTEYLINLPQESVVAVIHEAIEAGVNYFDMFWAQPAFRDHMGAAFKGHRGKAFLTAHLGSIEQDGQYAKTRDPQASEPFFIDFLKRLRIDYVDVLFLHNCDPQEDYETVMKPGGLLDLAKRFRKEGRARFIGFSCHNTATATQAVESEQIDALMFPVNLANYAAPGIRDLLKTCSSRNVGLVAMKPFAGGSLLRDKGTILVEDFQMGRRRMPGAPNRFEKTMTITPVQCLSYVLAQTGISTTVPGCKNPDELREALGYWEAGPEARDFSEVLPAFEQFARGECVYCNHCLPCPAEIDIGRTISLLEQARQDLTAELRAAYAALFIKADACLECGACEERCPFGVKVTAKMEQAARIFGA